MKLVELSPRENYELFPRYEDGTDGVVISLRLQTVGHLPCG